MFPAESLHAGQHELARRLMTLPHQEVSVLPEELLGLQPGDRVIHLNVEVSSEDFLRQQSCAIKKQFGHPKPSRGFAPRCFSMAQGRL